MLSSFEGDVRVRALAFADAFLGCAQAQVGVSRGELSTALDQVPVPVRDRKLAAGLRKLVEDRCELEAESSLEPIAVREQLFIAASAARRQGDAPEAFDREAVLVSVAEALGTEPAEVERALYADLRDSHLLRAVDAIEPAALVLAYDLAQAQAVLLRAVRVTATVHCAAPSAYRELFHKLKFRRLLHTIHPADGGGYRIEIDGPMSLFSSVTKYGLALALVLPAIRACDRWTLEAEVIWGRRRERLDFALSGDRRPSAGEATPSAPGEVLRLLERFRALDTDWQASPAEELLDLPGEGLCVPDLRFVHRETGEVAWLEVMGFWSREAVWRRVELVREGLPYHVLFAVSTRLRVSEAVLDESLPGALHVYKGTLGARAVADRLDALIQRPLRAMPS